MPGARPQNIEIVVATGVTSTSAGELGGCAEPAANARAKCGGVVKVEIVLAPTVQPTVPPSGLGPRVRAGLTALRPAKCRGVAAAPDLVKRFGGAAVVAFSCTFPCPPIATADHLVAAVGRRCGGCRWAGALVAFLVAAGVAIAIGPSIGDGTGITGKCVAPIGTGRVPQTAIDFDGDAIRLGVAESLACGKRENSAVLEYQSFLKPTTIPAASIEKVFIT